MKYNKVRRLSINFIINFELSKYSLFISVLSLAIFSLFSTFTFADQNYAPDRLAADLTFRFTCKESANPPSSLKITEFLGQKGFQTIDKVKLVTGNKAQNIYLVDVIAIDKKNRVVRFVGFSASPQDYHLVLNSPPPTQHDMVLEHDLQNFVSDELRCEVQTLSRHENGSAAEQTYNKFSSQIRDFFNEAQKLH